MTEFTENNFLAVETARTFIDEYRSLEDAPLKVMDKIIYSFGKHEGTVEHLKSSWRGRKRDFGSFYLNLDRSYQQAILKHWGLGTTQGDDYIEQCKRDPRGTLFLDPPFCIHWPHKLLIFFNNHGITETPVEGISLQSLPVDKDLRYGNSRNWGDYILSLNPTDQYQVLSQISVHVLGI